VMVVFEGIVNECLADAEQPADVLH
jgi:hypothetical protein